MKVFLLAFLFSFSLLAEDVTSVRKKDSKVGTEKVSHSPSSKGSRPEPTVIQSAVPFITSLGEPLADAPQEIKDRYQVFVANMINLIKDLRPPGGKNLFEWNGDRSSLGNKDFSLTFTTTKDPLLAMIAAKAPGGVAPNTDAFTVAAYNKKTGRILIETQLYVDRLFKDEKGNPRPDAALRTALALAHEIFGNVQDILENKAAHELAPTYESRRQQEVRAFQAGIDFLERLDKRLPEIYPDKVDIYRAQIAELLKQEKIGLNSWKTAKPK